jgi:hypothetical protein
MGKIFVDQTCLRIELLTGLTSAQLSGARVMEIQYRKPDATIGILDALELDDSSAIEEGILYADLESDSTLLDQRGAWKFWSYVIFSDGRKARGETVGVTIWSEDE